MKDKKVFKKFAIIYFSIITILCGIFIYYVVDSLILYENSAIEKYISNLVVDISKSAKRNKIDKYIDITSIKVSEYENTNTTVKEAYANIFKTKDITYKLVEDTIDSTPTYDIYADQELLFTLKLESSGNIKRMGLLTFPNWQIKEVTFPENRGVYYYDIYALDEYDIKVNGKSLNKELGKSSEPDEELEELGRFTKLPKIIKYELNNFTSEPKIEIYDSDKLVEFTKNKNVIEAYDLFNTDDIEELNKKLTTNVDVMSIAKMWSKFLTDDLAGTYHGYSTIKKYLIEDTYLWDMAYDWAHNVDITFVSNHTLVGFENEKVSNCVVYNENAFSCDVYLEKNMRLSYGKPRKDIMNDKFYFVYSEGMWKLVSMKANSEKVEEE